MSVRTTTRRRHTRHAVVLDAGAFVEFEYPSPNGRKYRLPIVDISPSGLSFKSEPHEPLPFEAGGTLNEVVIRIQECLIGGDLVLMHVTAKSDAMLCGALLYPRSDEDLLKLKAVIAGIEAVKVG